MYVYSSLIEAIEGLRKRGYTLDFNLKWNGLDCSNGQCDILHDEFVVDEFHRFEENTDPSEQSVIYAISSEKYGLKGIMINAYGVYAESVTDELMARLSIHTIESRK
jgi:hypothetical protein